MPGTKSSVVSLQPPSKVATDSGFLKNCWKMSRGALVLPGGLTKIWSAWMRCSPDRGARLNDVIYLHHHFNAISSQMDQTVMPNCGIKH